MSNAESANAFMNRYAVEVLGIKNYLCPESIYALRRLKGPLPSRALAVVFAAPSSSQEKLLEKIMASVHIFEYSFLQINSQSILERLLKERPADFICFFGGGFELKEEALSRRDIKLCALSELEGASLEVQKRKRELWERLKKWKSLFAV